jgi:hypothetical protein
MTFGNPSLEVVMIATVSVRRFRRPILWFIVAVQGAGVCGCGGDSDSSPRPPCSSTADCDASSYCHATRGDCGAGYCAERPRDGSDGNGNESYCGCDGNHYGSVFAARSRGVDVTLAESCSLKPNQFACGPQLICNAGSCDDTTWICAGSTYKNQTVWHCGYQLGPVSCDDAYAREVCGPSTKLAVCERICPGRVIVDCVEHW